MKQPKELKESQMQISLSAFLKSYNQNMPEGFPRASVALLKKFRQGHSILFKHGNLWSLEYHRKRLIDWLPQNINAVTH